MILFWRDSKGNITTKLDRTWPGPTTYLVPDNGFARDGLLGNTNLGLRISDHPVIKALCSLAGPLVSTSANISGAPPMKSAEEIKGCLVKKLIMFFWRAGQAGKTDRNKKHRNRRDFEMKTYRLAVMGNPIQTQ